MQELVSARPSRPLREVRDAKDRLLQRLRTTVGFGVTDAHHARWENTRMQSARNSAPSSDGRRASTTGAFMRYGNDTFSAIPAENGHSTQHSWFRRMDYAPRRPRMGTRPNGRATPTPSCVKPMSMPHFGCSGNDPVSEFNGQVLTVMLEDVFGARGRKVGRQACVEPLGGIAELGEHAAH